MTTKVHFCIPPLRAVVVLAQDWKFTLWRERRNTSLIQATGKVDEEVKPPKGTELAVDRIYIRNGAKSYDSVTFRVKKCPIEAYEKCRFWAKLPDVNKIICYPLGSKIEAVNEAFASFGEIGERTLEL